MKYYKGVQLDQDAHVKLRSVIESGKVKTISDAVRLLYSSCAEKEGLPQVERVDDKKEKIDRALMEARKA